MSRRDMRAFLAYVAGMLGDVAYSLQTRPTRPRKQLPGRRPVANR
jgi:hypothetical protein